MSATTESGQPSYVIQGNVVSMPCLVRDASSGVAMFMVPQAAAQKLIPGDRLEVVEAAPGEAQLILGFVDYRDNDLGDYNEVMVVLMVRPRDGSGSEGTFIYKLPVNQSFTCEAGSKIWGFPKTVDEIDVQYGEASVRCVLSMNGQHVFSLTLPRTPAVPMDMPDIEMVTYTFIDGRPHVVPFTSGGTGTGVAMGGDGFELVLGTHPLANELRGLGLPSAPFMTTWTENMHGSFAAPQSLG